MLGHLSAALLSARPCVISKTNLHLNFIASRVLGDKLALDCRLWSTLQMTAQGEEGIGLCQLLAWGRARTPQAGVWYPGLASATGCSDVVAK